MRSIKEKSELDISKFRAEKEAQYQRDYEAVSEKLDSHAGCYFS